MNDLIVKNVDLFGDTVVAAQDKEGVIWAGVKWICEGIGFSDGQRQRQTSNIGEDIVLSKGVANLPLHTKFPKEEFSHTFNQRYLYDNRKYSFNTSYCMIMEHS